MSRVLQEALLQACLEVLVGVHSFSSARAQRTVVFYGGRLSSPLTQGRASERTHMEQWGRKRIPAQPTRSANSPGDQWGDRHHSQVALTSWKHSFYRMSFHSHHNPGKVYKWENWTKQGSHVLCDFSKSDRSDSKPVLLDSLMGSTPSSGGILKKN